MSNLLKGARFYFSKMTGLESLGMDSRSLKRFFKAVFQTGFGEKVIDKIEGKTITINGGYNIVDNFVIYEIFNDSTSVLTTLKKVDVNNFESKVDLSAISGQCSIRVPPIGLEFSEDKSGNHLYKIDENRWFIITDSSFGVKAGEFSRMAGARNNSGSITAFIVSSQEILSSQGMHCGVAMPNTAFVVGEPEKLFNYYLSTGANEFQVDFALFPGRSFAGRNPSGNISALSSAAIFSKCFVGKERSEIKSLRASSSSSDEDAIDFEFNDIRNVNYKILYSGSDLIAVLHDAKLNVYAAKLGELPK